MDEKEHIEKKYNGIDLVKWIMAIFVIAIHTHPIKEMQDSYIYIIYEVAIAMAVPFFFMASAYLLFYKMKGSYFDEDNIKIINKYTVKTIKFYFIWNLVYFPLAIYGFIQDGSGIIESILKYLRGFFFIGEQFYSWPLWYLLSTIYAISLIRILLKKKWKEWHILLLSLFVFVIAQIITYMMKNQQNLNGILYTFSQIIKLSIANGRILTGFCYISIGMCIAKYRRNINWKILLIANIIAFAISVIYSNFISTLLLNIVFLLLVLAIKLKDKKIYYYLRKSSTVMYFTHMLFFFILGLEFGMNQNEGLMGFLFTLICTIILSLIIIIMQKKKEYKILKMLFN